MLFSFIGIGLLIILIQQWKYNPSEEISYKNFLKAMELYNSGKPAEGQVMNLHYRIKDNELVIEKRNVIYEGHMNDPEFIDLFSEKRKPLIEDSAFKDLKELNKAREEYIEKARNDCLDKQKNKQYE